MLKSISVTNFKNETLEMELAHPEKSGLIVYNIEGIGGGKASINTSDSATGDGSWYNSARAEARNIVIYAKLMQLPSVEEVRHKVYQYFPLKKQVRLTFTTDIRTVYIDGYVESNETPIFSSEEYSTISIVCPDPFFYTVGASYTIFSGVIPLFEFPFADDCLDSDDIKPAATWNPNLISNFNFLQPRNASGRTMFTSPGVTIDDWMFENESIGNASIVVADNGLRINQYGTNSKTVKLYNTFGALEDQNQYTASYFDATGTHTLTFTVERPDIAEAFEQTFEGTNERVKIQILSEAGSSIYRFQFLVSPGETYTLTVKAVKVEIGDKQTLTDENGEIMVDPGTQLTTLGTIEFSEVANQTQAIINYQGSTNVGVTIVLSLSGAANDINITNVTTNEHMLLLTDRISAISGAVLGAGDSIKINTTRSHKQITLHKNSGESYNIVGCLARGSKWFELSAGDNLFEIEASSGTGFLTATFNYNEAHAGV